MLAEPYIWLIFVPLEAFLTTFLRIQIILGEFQ